MAEKAGVTVLTGAHLRLRGGGQGLEFVIDPSQAQMQKMIEPLLAPAHPHTLEALLDEPLAGPFSHATTDG